MSNVNFPTNNSQKIAGLWATDHTLADEGSFFTACSPTPLTAITGTASLVADGTGGASLVLAVAGEAPTLRADLELALGKEYLDAEIARARAEVG